MNIEFSWGKLSVMDNSFRPGITRKEAHSTNEFQGKVAGVTGAARVESSDSTAIQQIS